MSISIPKIAPARAISLSVFAVLAVMLRGSELQAVEASVIKSAWDKREAAIQSFQYDADMDWTKTVVTIGKADLFGKPVDKNDKTSPVVLSSKLTFSMQAGKFASQNLGEVWDQGERRKEFRNYRASFNRVHDKTLLEGGMWPIGNVRSGEKIEMDQLMHNIRLIPFWLAYSPTRLLTSRLYRCDELSVGSGNEIHNDVECVELLVPRDNKKWRGVIYVDPTRDFVPVKFVQEFERKILIEHTISYASNTRVGWVVSSWQSNYFHDSGEIKQSYAGVVKRVSINEPLDEKLFELEFPVGTRIVEKTGDARKYYIQETPQTRRQIPESQFGKLPDAHLTSANANSRVPIVVTVVVTFALMAMVFMKHRRNSAR